MSRDRVFEARVGIRTRTLVRDVLWLIRSVSYVDLNSDVARTVFLAGSGRSGTTWLQELVDRRHDYRVLFEPFTPDRVRQVAHFRELQYMRCDDGDASYVQPVERIVRGDIRNPWIDHLNHARIPKRRLIKDIRSNLLLCWLRRLMPDLPIIWLIRNPASVVESALRLGWKDHLDDLLSQQDLVADHLVGHERWLADLQSPAGRMAAQWAIEQLVPFRQLERADVHLVFYEDLVRWPRECAGRVLAYVGQEWDSDAAAAISRRSHLARKKPHFAGSGTTPGERAGDRGVGREVRAVVARLGLGRLYRDDGMPNDVEARRLLGSSNA